MARARKRIDPALLAQLDPPSSAKSASLVEAVVQLRPEKAGEVLPPAERTEQVVRSLVSRVSRKVGLKPADLNVFPNLACFVIAAPGDFLRELLDQPEVQGAMPNRPTAAGTRGPAPRRPPPRRPFRR